MNGGGFGYSRLQIIIHDNKQSLPLTTHFPRPLEANDFAQQLLGPRHPYGSYGGYLYLAAPPDTGKSDFLAHDLLPALVAHGSLPVCVTTGFDQAFTPGELITEAIKRTIATVQGSLAREFPIVDLTNVDITRRQTVHWSKLRKPGNVRHRLRPSNPAEGGKQASRTGDR